VTAFRRLTTGGGHIDRGRPVAFSFDGKNYSGFAGDTLASALLANDVTLIGRSFKYHRPRGIVSAGVEEPNALFTLGDGARTEPNIPGTVVELIPGLAARSQNAWPSPGFDLMAVNQLAAPLFQSGFYYKTFMGPTRGAWMFYEPFIRKAAGLGAATRAFDPDRYQTRYEFCDVLVIGAGPAGLAAAVSAGRTGARVVVAEQDALPGGALLAEPAHDSWRQARLAEIASLATVKTLTRTTAIGLYDDNLVVLVERRDHLKPDPAKGEARQVLTMLQAKAIVFATGAIERPLVFANNDRPGVMLASAVRLYLNRFGVAPSSRAVVATNNDSAYSTALDLTAAGTAVTLADSRATIAPELMALAAGAGIAIFPGTGVADVKGRSRVREVRLDGAHSASVACEVLAVSAGWSPTVHLTSHNGIKPRYDERIAGFVPGGFAPSHFGAGAVMGTFGLNAVIREGAETGRQAAETAGATGGAGSVPVTEIEDRPYAILPTWSPQVQ
jgi:sarcosine oxidase subunit alpha